ncbi:dihydroorotase [Pedobacter sp. SD-b]|uniref:Dihydroorotase n=1 Tax=Pedobacter segetis TaxID=2793069 RepID=A0ABS1BKT4_9SPHI|nr:dihydroorotase [Pedobacter segetis]MBK0383508.1 dihydroorotase [Pedobacter segetis]
MIESILIKSCKVIDPNSRHNQKVVDVLIENGTIKKIGGNLVFSGETINGSGKYLSPGFFDMNVSFGEPGLETKEDFETGSKTAIAGGFTGLAIMPHNLPTTDSKSQVEFLINKANGNLVDIYPYGCLSQKREGKDLAELFDMKNSGAIAFTDGDKPIQDAGLMERALLYAKGFDALVLSYPEDGSIAGKAKMNEGAMSTLLGMKGIPSLAEELMVVRDLYLTEYTESKVHFSTISTAHSVELIKAAKKKGIKVTCDVAVHHLVLTDEAVKDFDSNYKVKPPLRTLKDVKALIKGLKEGVIDAVVSQHTPQEIEFKEVEFEIAKYGILGLQTVLPIMLKAGFTVEEVVEKLSIKPREILGLQIPKIEEEQKANLVLFNEEEWLYNQDTNFSKSANTPFLNKHLKGKIWLTCNNDQIIVSN